MYHTIIPILLFVLGYKFFGMMAASGIMCTASLVLIVFDSLIRKTPTPKIVWFTTIISSAVFTMALLTTNPMLIKMKPTIINLLLATVILASLALGHNPLVDLLGSTLTVRRNVMDVLAKRWACFFLFIAITNEAVWRNFSEDTWVNFKAFGILMLNMLFVITQAPIIMRGAKDSIDTKESTSSKISG